MEKFEISKFTELYLKDNHKWNYIYYKTFIELSDLVDDYVNPSDYFVKEVNITEMMKEIEKYVSLDWFLLNDIGAAFIKRKDGIFIVYYPGEREGYEQFIADFASLGEAVIAKLKHDLFWINVQKVID